MSNLLIGHLLKSDESKISSLPVAEGRVVYSEKNGMQFVDYGGKRHTTGSVLSGIFNGTSYMNFSNASLSINNVLTALYANGIPDGQLITLKNKMYQYRVFDGYHMLAKTDNSQVRVTTAGNIAYVLHFPDAASGATTYVDLVVSTYDSVNKFKTFFLRIKNGVLDTTLCKDFDGDFSTSTCPITTSPAAANNSICFIKTSVSVTTVHVNSCSLTVNGSGFSEVELFPVIVAAAVS